MNDHKEQVDLITAVIDLAASRREPINAYGDYDEWLTFESITNALEEVCQKLGAGRHLEQSCYQTLLRMSAESERHLTWWEKIEHIDHYLDPSSHSKGKKQKQSSKNALSTSQSHLIRLVDPQYGIHVRPTSVTTMNPSTLLEANQLSMLLNDTYGFQSDYTYAQTKRTPMTFEDHNNSNSFTIQRNLDTSNTYNSSLRSTRSASGMRMNNSTTDRHIHFSEPLDEVKSYERWKEVNSKLSDIQNESHQIKDNISQLLHQSSPAVTVGNRGTTTTPTTPEMSKSSHHRGDWTLSPSIIYPNISTNCPDTPAAAATDGDTSVGLLPPQPAAPPSVSNSSYTSTSANNVSKARSKEYSDLLRQSGVMNKYLGLSRLGATSPDGKVRARSHSPRRSSLPTKNEDAQSNKISNPQKVAAPISSPDLSTGGGKAGRKPLFDSPPPPTPVPKQHHNSVNDTIYQGSTLYGAYTRAQSTPLSTNTGIAPHVPYYTPGRVVPLALQGDGGWGGVYTPEGHIHVDALDFDPRSLAQDGFASNADTSMLPPGHILDEDQFISTITSTTRILILFHRWLLQRSDHNNIHYGDDRNSALMLAVHFSGLDDFVSSLFGLEQWLRDKMRLIVATEAKSYVFRTWNLKYGVSSQARIFWRRRRLHGGFESFLEYAMKRRMHRKNALHALAARRRHAQILHMNPVLRHRPVYSVNSAFNESSLNNDLTNDENEGSDHIPSRSLSDLSGLNKYSSLDMSMFNSEKRQQMKRAQYLTSLSIRDIVNDVKSALLTYSRGGNNSEGLKVKTQEYLHAQDTVALLFAFRRLYHRCIYITRQQRVRQKQRRSRLTAVLALWKDSWSAKTVVEKAMEPRVSRIVEEMKYVKIRIAVRKLFVNIGISKKEKDKLHRYAQRIRSKPLFLKAIHSIRCQAYVKCFALLKQNYISCSPSAAEQRASDEHYDAFSLQFAVRKWLCWYKAHSSNRRRGVRGEANKRAFMGFLLHRAHIWHIVQPNKNSSGTSMSTDTFLELPVVKNMHITRDITRQTVHLFMMRRALHRLSRVGRCVRVFFSQMELQFAQALCRRSLPSERKKYMQMINGCSCRIWPSPKTSKLFPEESVNREVSFRLPDSKAPVLARATTQKPYKLIGIHPHTLRYYMRTVVNNLSLEHNENSTSSSSTLSTSTGGVTASGVGSSNSIRRNAEFLIPFLQKPITTLSGGVLSNTPQLLRLTRRWRQLCRDRTYLRKLSEKIKRKRGRAVLHDIFEKWVSAFHNQKESSRFVKRRAMNQLKQYLTRHRVLKRANHKTRRGVGVRHWQRLISAHLHHTELRRLHSGHFYNSIMSGSSKKIHSFIVNHTFVPFSVRHFLSHYPSYRFPIYKKRDAGYWEQSSQSAAYQALQVLCQHYQVYSHKHHLAHHLEMFQHHHHEEFHPGDNQRVSTGNRGDMFPHTYASPMLRVSSENAVFTRGRGSGANKPLHLTPGAMLSDQPFSVSAMIGNKYRRDADLSTSWDALDNHNGGDGGGRVRGGGGKVAGFSPSRNRSPSKGLSIETPFTPAYGKKYSLTPGAALYDAGGERPPCASEMAAAAVFLSHWISECLLQYYALRRGLYLLRKFAVSRRRGHIVVRKVHNNKKQHAFNMIWSNKRDFKLSKQLELRRLKSFFFRMRVKTVVLKVRHNLMRKNLQRMRSYYRYRIILRTWETAWRTKIRGSWDRLIGFTNRREQIASAVRQLRERRLYRDTVRNMCSITTANLWRRKRDRVSGLRAFVLHYNHNVQEMDRDEVVRVYAQAKHFTALKENLLSLLKQRLDSIVGMNYRKKHALIRGFLAIASNVRERTREIREDVLKDSLFGSIHTLRTSHSSYHNHSFRDYEADYNYDYDTTTSKVLNTFNSFREKQLLRASSRYQHEFSRRGSFSPYVSDTLPLPSPVPPSHSLDTPIRRSSMMRLPPPPPRISHDMLTEVVPHSEEDDDDDGGGGGREGLICRTQSAGLSRSTSLLPRSPSMRSPTPAPTPTPIGVALSRQPSAAQLLFGTVRSSNNTTHSLRSDRKSVVIVENNNTSTATNTSRQQNRSSTAAAMTQRRKSMQRLSRADSNDSLDSLDVDLVSVSSLQTKQLSPTRNSVSGPISSMYSPYLPQSRRASTGALTGRNDAGTNTSTYTQRSPAGTHDASAGVDGARSNMVVGDRAANNSSSRYRPFVNTSITSNNNNTVITNNTSVRSNVRSSTGMSRKSSLHDVHADALAAPTTELPLPSNRIDASIGAGPSSILITSPAYVPTPRLPRADSRINFHDSVNNNSFYRGSSIGGGGDNMRRSSVNLSSLSRRASMNMSYTDPSQQPFSPLTQYSGDDVGVREQRGFFQDDASTDASTFRDGQGGRQPQQQGSTRLQRKRSFIHEQRIEESEENILILERAMQRGLWQKWRFNIEYRKKMIRFCGLYLRTRMQLLGLQILRWQTTVDKRQRVRLLGIDKKLFFTRLSDFVARADEQRQIQDFADKYYVVMAMKLTIRRWRARVSKITSSSTHYHRAIVFSRKRSCNLFLLNLKASCVSLAVVNEGNSFYSSPDRKRVEQRKSGHDHKGRIKAENVSNKHIYWSSKQKRQSREKYSDDDDDGDGDGIGAVEDERVERGTRYNQPQLRHKSVGALTPAAIRSLLSKK